MNVIINRVIKIFKPWFYVDTRILGLFRILLGTLCFIDISRRWSLIDVFYTNDGIISIGTSNSFYKYFTLLSTFTKSGEVHAFFFIGLIFSFLLIIGYRTKLSQIICSVIIISIHNRAIILENAGDLMFNNILVLSLFLPLGISLSIDSLNKSLILFNEKSPFHLNNRELALDNSKKIFSMAYFAFLIQIASIYFFTGLNKTGYDWMGGSAVYKMYQLDTFITPVGYFIRNFLSDFNLWLSVSKLLTYSTLCLEFLAPIFIFFPFYSYILRFIMFISLVIFHVSIRTSVTVGLFSFTMFCILILLIDKRILDMLKNYFKRKFHYKSYVLFYDSDCGFCHFTARLIKRFDIYQQIEFADSSYKGKKPINYKELSDETVILVDDVNNIQWTKHEAFGKILYILPFGFLISWILFVPGLNKIFEKVYDITSLYRTEISKFLGLQACDLNTNNNQNSIINTFQESTARRLSSLTLQICSSVFVSVLIIASINYCLVANEAVNDYMDTYGFKKFRYNTSLKKIVTYPRAIQRWNMFSPTVLGTDKTIIVEATLSNGDIIDPFTGNTAILDNVDYESLWHGRNQFWRKFFSRVSKKQNSKYVTTFEKWMKKSNNTYFSKTLNNQRIRSVKIWNVYQRNSDLNSNSEKNVYKKLLNQSPKTKNRK